MADSHLSLHTQKPDSGPVYSYMERNVYIISRPMAHKFIFLIYSFCQILFSSEILKTRCLVGIIVDVSIILMCSLKQESVWIHLSEGCCTESCL